MKTIWKFNLAAEEKQTVKMPYNSKPVHVGLDPSGELCLWAEVDPDNQLFDEIFYIVGTGCTIPYEVVKHIGTIVQGWYVFHVYC